MKKYVKQSGNPSKDGLYDTDRGVYLFFKSNWYAHFKSLEQFLAVRAKDNLPEYYYEQLIED